LKSIEADPVGIVVVVSVVYIESEIYKKKIDKTLKNGIILI